MDDSYIGDGDKSRESETCIIEGERGLEGVRARSRHRGGPPPDEIRLRRDDEAVSPVVLSQKPSSSQAHSPRATSPRIYLLQPLVLLASPIIYTSISSRTEQQHLSHSSLLQPLALLLYTLTLCCSLTARTSHIYICREKPLTTWPAALLTSYSRGEKAAPATSSPPRSSLLHYAKTTAPQSSISLCTALVHILSPPLGMGGRERERERWYSVECARYVRPLAPNTHDVVRRCTEPSSCCSLAARSSRKENDGTYIYGRWGHWYRDGLIYIVFFPKVSRARSPAREVFALCAVCALYR